MWLPLLGLIVGILLGSIFTFSIPLQYATYLSIAVLAGLDSLLGGWRAVIEDTFDGLVLLSGFFTNALLAAFLAFLGDLLGLDLYLAAVIAFGLRIFANIGYIRRDLISQLRKRRRAADAADPLEDTIELEELRLLNQELARFQGFPAGEEETEAAQQIQKNLDNNY